MKNQTAYQSAKEYVKINAKSAKTFYKNDKPAVRQSINDSVDIICKNYNLSEYQRDLLSLYACKLHPKN